MVAHGNVPLRVDFREGHIDCSSRVRRWVAHLQFLLDKPQIPYVDLILIDGDILYVPQRESYRLALSRPTVDRRVLLIFHTACLWVHGDRSDLSFIESQVIR